VAQVVTGDSLDNDLGRHLAPLGMCELFDKSAVETVSSNANSIAATTKTLPTRPTPEANEYDRKIIL
jgi:hypothetical protein